MKRICILFLVGLSCLAIQLKAQVQNPVKWSYALKNLSANTYELHLLATIAGGWHIYAQQQLEGAIAVPTKISFKKAAGLTLVGLPAEVGKKETHEIRELGITNLQYSEKVDFVQKIMIKGTAVKAVAGSLVYQVCDEHMCLPPETVNFSIPVKR